MIAPDFLSHKATSWSSRPTVGSHRINSVTRKSVIRRDSASQKYNSSQQELSLVSFADWATEFHELDIHICSLCCFSDHYGLWFLWALRSVFVMPRLCKATAAFCMSYEVAAWKEALMDLLHEETLVCALNGSVELLTGCLMSVGQEVVMTKLYLLFPRGCGSPANNDHH